MKIEIKIGNGSKVVEFNSNHIYDDPDTMITYMQNVLLEHTNCTIIGVNNFLLYTANAMILNHIIQGNVDLPESMIGKSKLDPKNVKIYEVNEDGEKNNIQNVEGMVGDNYFNQLMGRIMDGYYEALNYYEG